MKSIYTRKIAEEGLIKYLPDVNMTDRDKEIVNRFLEEVFTYRALGDAYGISRECVRQIVEKFARKAHHIYTKNTGEIKNDKASNLF